MITVVSHDAGGAEMVSSYLRRHGLPYLGVLAGPALRVFERKLGPVAAQPLDQAIGRATTVLCGTSWQSDLELQAIRAARAQGTHTIAFLDQWVCYRERFVRAGETTLPDEFWVADVMAEAMARAECPGVPVSVVGNPYFDDLREELARTAPRVRRAGEGLSVLYVCEPLGEQARLQYGDERYWGYVEEEALQYCLATLETLGHPVAKVTIRPHPAEPAGKYDWAVRGGDRPVTIGGSRTRLAELADADVVIGCESMAMVVALLAGKRVISSIPPGGKPCSLPHPEIEHLQRLVAVAATR